MTPINQNMVQTSNTENTSKKTSNVKEVKFYEMSNRIYSKSTYIKAMQENLELIRKVIWVDPTYKSYQEFIKSECVKMSKADKDKAIQTYQWFIKTNVWH